eukprot:gene41031-50765_t
MKNNPKTLAIEMTVTPFAPLDGSQDSSRQKSPTSVSSVVKDTFAEQLPAEQQLVKVKQFEVEILPTLQISKRLLVILAVMWIAYTSLVISLTTTSKCSTHFDAIFAAIYVPLGVTIVYGVCHNPTSKKLNVAKGSEESDHSTVDPATPTPVELKSSSCSSEDAQDTMMLTASADLESGASVITTPSESAPKNPNEFDFQRDSCSLASLACVIGVICSLLGVGGGEMYGPLMLAYNVMPQVSSATTSMMSFWNTLPNIVRQAVAGELDYATGAILYVIGLFGGFIGRKAGLYVASKGRPSAIVFALSVILFFSTVNYIYQLSSTEFEAQIEDYC